MQNTTANPSSFTRGEILQPLPPPASLVGPIGWVRANLLSSPLQALLTLVGAYIAYKLVWTFVDFTIIRAVWTGADRDACLDEKVGRSVGACWPFVWAKFGQFMYGFYPLEHRWRVDLTGIIAIALLTPLLIPSVPYKALNAVLFFGAFPILAFNLLYGGSILNPWLVVLGWLAVLAGISLLVAYLMSRAEGGANEFLLKYGAGALAAGVAALLIVRSGMFAVPELPVVETRQWGGLLVTLVVATVGIVAALPIGVALALGRRSKMPIIRFLSVAIIELVRGVPLITVLFFATYMLPLFLERSPDAMVRVLVGVSIFSGAYMAETIRGGLQAIPKGQFEGAMALGLNYPRMMGLIVMPQALKLVIPGIVNAFIGLFKDTTLVSIVAIFDLLGGMRAGFTDPQWASPVTLYTGFAFAGIIYFAFCYFMSRYSIFVENRLNTGRRR
ncbi:amino acid ABC transporter permease [Phreatobacter oligotrophus]|uniref:amino acid ABC transporter permease n=1 Tax=Phreatobacter oligotrophus TaxID=1122261 RepID=UPI002354E970|nr:amino acid ABC transporter permease [Phreatobacter oligotrophus]MBX9989949.1 amino acid ABC transporter permease [Phreatobacter oligotrophus]